jgi:rhodanese-related sulfurtransferase
MAVTQATTHELSLEESEARVGSGAAYIDMRAVSDYLDVHIPGSISLQYEFGPGFPVRARDCIPLEVPLVLLDRGDVDVPFAAASLRGKGFAVLGVLTDGINAWADKHGTPGSTEVFEGPETPSGTLLDVGDPGAPRLPEATRTPIERLWTHTPPLGNDTAVIIAGRGVRAALAVGMLERAGHERIAFWRWKPREARR